MNENLVKLAELVNGLPYEEQKVLWDVMSALRGPDNDDLTLKHATTSIIRQKLFGTYCTLGGYVDINGDTLQRVELRQANQHINYCHPNRHFLMHAQRAFETLGLNWEALNETGT